MTRSHAVTAVGPTDPSLSDHQAAPASPARPPAEPSLKRLAVTGTAWTLIGHIASQLIRMAGHVVVAQFLGPAVFGIMAMADVVMTGLRMFSDTGTGPSIIQHKRGDDPDFLNTAWTVNVIRHGGLFLAACLLAWPVAAYRDQPLLLWIIPVGALAALIRGFISTAPATLHRHLRIRTLELFELSREVVRNAGKVVFAILLRNVWALVIGGLIGGVYSLIVSHTVISQGRNRFCWDREAVKHLVRFGRWIFIATALTFVIGQGDKIVLAGFLSDADLGLYAIAFTWALAIPQAVRAVTNRVLFPVYSMIADRSAPHVRRKILLTRSLLLLATLPPLCVFAIGGGVFIRIIYPTEFHGAGWILQLLAFGGIFRIIEVTMSPILLAKGDSFRHMLVLVTQAALLLIAVAVGGCLAGYAGVVVGIALSHLLNYPILGFAIKKYGVWTPLFDLAFMYGFGLPTMAAISYFD
jgi:O-antigen/teichoic acid export membrane protein